MLTETQKNPPELRCAIFNRCSTEDEAQTNALALQVQQSREIAQAKGWKIVEQYVESVTGTYKAPRKEYRRMLADMETDKFDVIVIKSLDRLMRSSADWYEFLDTMLRNHKRLYIYMEHRFFDNAQHGFMSGIKMAMHAQFSRVLSEKVKNSHRYRQQHKTGVNITRAMFGWRKTGKNQYEIDETQAGYIRQAAAMILDGHGFHSVAKAMYGQGARNSRGGYMDASVWRCILTSPRCYGCMVMHKTERNFDTKTVDAMPQDKWIYWENCLPPILDKPYWEQMMTVINSRKRAEGQLPNWHMYPLSGKIICGICGSTYYRSPYRSRYKDKTYLTVHWKCMQASEFGRSGHECSCMGENIDEAKLLPLLEQTGARYFDRIFSDDDSLIQNALSMIRKMLREQCGQDDLHQLRAKLEQQKRKKQVLFEKLMNETVNDADFRMYNEMQTEKIAELETKITALETASETLLENEQRLMKMEEALRHGTVIQFAKGAALIELIETITVNPNSTLIIRFDKRKIMGMLDLQDPEQEDLVQDEQYFLVTVPYNGSRMKRLRIADEKHRLLELISQAPDATFEEMAAALDMTRNQVGARITNLLKHGYLERDMVGNLVVISDYPEQT